MINCTSRRHSSRRKFVAVLSAGPALCRAPAVVSAAPLLEAKCGSGNVPFAHPLGTRMHQAWHAIEQESDGAIKVRFFTDDALGTPIAQVEQVRLGVIQFMLVGGAGLPQVKPIFSIDGLGFAFNDAQEVFRAYDGALGSRIRSEFTPFGLVAVGKFQLNGPFQIMNSLRPIRTPADLAGIKLRVTTAPVIIDLISMLGASPVPIPGSQAYTAMQTHLADGLGSTLDLLYAQHFYEILKYLSIMNYSWSVYIMLANGEAWRGIPDRFKDVITRNIDKYATLQRADADASQTSLLDKFRQQGIAVNTADQRPFRAPLGPYYAKYRQVFGADVWALLERTVGRLG